MTEYTNHDRACAGRTAVYKYAEAKEGEPFLYEDFETVFKDLLTDLHHTADANQIDIDDLFRRAKEMYEEEKREDF